MNVQDCLTKLAESDEECGRLRALYDGMEKRLKSVKAAEFMRCKGEGTIAERESIAYNSEAYRKAIDDYENARADFEILNNQRNTWELGFKYWQSNNANRRQAGGNL